MLNSFFTLPFFFIYLSYLSHFLAKFHISNNFYLHSALTPQIWTPNKRLHTLPQTIFVITAKKIKITFNSISIKVFSNNMLRFYCLKPYLDDNCLASCYNTLIFPKRNNYHLNRAVYSFRQWFSQFFLPQKKWPIRQQNNWLNSMRKIKYAKQNK